MTLWQVIIIVVLFGAYQDSSATLCMDIQSNILAVWDVLLLTDRATHHENKLFSVNRGGDTVKGWIFGRMGIISTNHGLLWVRPNSAPHCTDGTKIWLLLEAAPWFSSQGL